MNFQNTILTPAGQLILFDSGRVAHTETTPQPVWWSGGGEVGRKRLLSIFLRWGILSMGNCHVTPPTLCIFVDELAKKVLREFYRFQLTCMEPKHVNANCWLTVLSRRRTSPFPTDTKLYNKIAEKCVAIAEKEGVKLRQTYRRTLKKLILAQRFRNHPKNYKKARKAARKLKTIAGRLMRDLGRKLSVNAFGHYSSLFKIFEQVLDQKRNTSNKIYSIHEPEVYCIGKGKAHKKYEFGAKASIAVTKNSGIIVGAVSHPQNVHDSKTLVDVISQSSELRGQCPTVAICDRGYRGKSKVGETQILIPKPSGKRATAYQRQKTRKRFRRRAGSSSWICL